MPVTKKSAAVLKKSATKKAVRKAVASKLTRKPKAATDEATTPAKPVKASATKTVKRIVKKSGTKTAAPRKRADATTLSVDFAPGTDMHTAFQEVLTGGESRAAVSHRLADMWAEKTTRSGTAKPVSTIMNHVVRRALANGYTVEQHWRVVKVDGTVVAEGSGKAPEPAKTISKKAVRKPTVSKAVKATTSAKPVKKAVKRVKKA